MKWLKQRAKPTADSSPKRPAEQTVLVDVLDHTLTDRLAPGSLSLEVSDCCSYSEVEWVRVWYLRDWPLSFGYRHWQRLLQFSGDVRVSMFHKPLDPASVGPQLERQATAFQADNMLRALQKRDLSMATGKDLADVQSAQWQVQVEGQPFYYLTVALSLFAGSKAQLDELSDGLEDIFRAASIVADRVRWDQLPSLTAMQPLNLNTLGEHQRNMPLEALTQFFPFTGSETVMPDGLYYGQSIYTGMNVVMDPWALENANIMIIGPPGGGKSYWLKDLITQCVTRNIRAYVLDVEDEYRKLCQDLGGVYLDMGIKSEHKINPLEPDPEEDKPVGERSGLAGSYESFKEWLVTAIGRAFEPGDLPVLDRCYQSTFEDFDITLKDPLSLRRKPPRLEDLHAKLLDDGSPYATRLADELYPMARGMESEAFNCHTTVNVRSNPLVVFGLKSVPDAMKARRIRQVQQLTWNQMLSNVNLRQTIEVVDEAWVLLQHAHTARDVAERARRFRKKNGALFVATQHADDFAMTPHARAVLQMAASHMLFRQKGNSVGLLQDLFKLTDAEAQSLTKMNAGEYLLLTPLARTALRKEVPPSRDRLYTTKPKDMLAYRAQEARGAA
jgi:hypothetical protein